MRADKKIRMAPAIAGKKLARDKARFAADRLYLRVQQTQFLFQCLAGGVEWRQFKCRNRDNGLVARRASRWWKFTRCNRNSHPERSTAKSKDPVASWFTGALDFARDDSYIADPQPP